MFGTPPDVLMALPPISKIPVKFTVPLCVKPPLFSGIVAPAVPVLSAAAVPSDAVVTTVSCPPAFQVMTGTTVAEPIGPPATMTPPSATSPEPVPNGEKAGAANAPPGPLDVIAAPAPMTGFVSVGEGIANPLGNVVESPRTPLLSYSTPPLVFGEMIVVPGAIDATPSDARLTTVPLMSMYSGNVVAPPPAP